MRQNGIRSNVRFPYAAKKAKGGNISLAGNVSSQYISSLLMIAPLLPQGLHLELTGDIYSRPYIQMTLNQMENFGIKYTWEGKTIHVPNQQYQPASYQVESDWSGASYWYSIVSLAKNAHVELLGLKPESLQGDSVIANIMTDLGVRSTFTSDGVLLEKKPIPVNHNIELDFTACPDLAQTIVAMCSVKKIGLLMTGLESLKIKETDRVKALQNEIKKFGCELHEDYGYWSLRFGAWAAARASQLSNKKPIPIDTYDDHRMAMAFAPLALAHDLEIENPDVVQKSYPRYWEDLEKVGFRLEKGSV